MLEKVFLYFNVWENEEIKKGVKKVKLELVNFLTFVCLSRKIKDIEEILQLIKLKDFRDSYETRNFEDVNIIG